MKVSTNEHAEERFTAGRPDGNTQAAAGVETRREPVAPAEVSGPSGRSESSESSESSELSDSPKETETPPPALMLDVEKEIESCLTTADIAFERLEFCFAGQYYERALVLLAEDEEKHKKNIRRCLQNMVDVHLFLDRPKQALATMRALREVEDNADYKQTALTILLKVGSLCESEQKFSDALEHYREAQAIAAEILAPTDPLSQRLNTATSGLQNKIAGIEPQVDSAATGKDSGTFKRKPGLAQALKQGNQERKENARAQKQPALGADNVSLLQATSETRPLGDSPLTFFRQEMEIVFHNGKRLLQSGDLEGAKDDLENAVQLLQQMGWKESPEMIACLRYLTSIYLDLADPEKAISSLDALSSADASAGKAPETVVALSRAASTFANAGRYEEAWSTYWRALTLASELLKPDDPLMEQLNSSYIELQKKISPSRSRLSVKQLEEQDRLISKSRIGQPNNLFQRQTASNNKTIQSPENNQRERTASPSVQVTPRANPVWLHPGIRLIARSPVSSLLISLLLLLGCANAFTLLRLENAGKSASLTPFIANDMTGLAFETVDKGLGVSIISPQLCTMTRDGHALSARYTALSGSQQNLGLLFWGSMHRKEYWYQLTADGLLDNNRIALYRSDAPEVQVARNMWRYASFANEYYKEGRMYPADAEKCRASYPEYQYINPVTGKPDYASIILQKGNTAQDMTFVQRGEGERHWRPAAIYCVCLGYKKFVIHGFDRNGKPLTCSDPNRFFVIECADGLTVTKPPQILPDAEQRKSADAVQLAASSDHSPAKDVRVFLYEEPDLESTVAWLRRLIPTMVVTASLSSALWLHISYKYNYRRNVKLSSIVAYVFSSLLLAVWYFCVLQPG